MEIETCIEKGRSEEARKWFEQARNIGGASIEFQFVEMMVLAAEGKWNAVAAKAKDGMSSYQAPWNRAAFASWLGPAVVLDGGNLSEAEAACAEAMSVAPWEPAMQTAQALVSVAQGRIEEAEMFLRKSYGSRLPWAARASRANVWTEIYRRRGDQINQRKWQGRANAIDPAGVFRIRPRDVPESAAVVAGHGGA